ncbi:MAG: helix-turn-helix domain-containing protein [Stackebrandtia sp.]
MSPTADPTAMLAHKLRDLRRHGRPNVSLTQRELADVFGVRDSLISGWENPDGRVLPPKERLDAYARFFATRRSADRLLDPPDLTQDERRKFEELKAELFGLRQSAVSRSEPVPAASPTTTVLGGPWHFGDAKPVTVVCPELPSRLVAQAKSPDDEDRLYGRLYSFADLDSLVALYGHICAANPAAEALLRKDRELSRDDFTNHLVLLAGVDWIRSPRIKRLHRSLPMQQFSHGSGDSWAAGFAPSIRNGDDGTYPAHEEESVCPEYDDETGTLISDVGLFLRMPNPFNRKRTFTWCSAVDGRGVLGAVRALTDTRFRDRNAQYLKDRFGDAKRVSFLFRIDILDDEPLTPDWSETAISKTERRNVT